jgi:hypothetical protein
MEKRTPPIGDPNVAAIPKAPHAPSIIPQISSKTFINKYWIFNLNKPNDK